MSVLSALQSATLPAAQAAAGQPSLVQQLIPLALIIAVFYFLLIRPQQKRLREHQTLVSSLKRNDKVMTGGGIVGTIKKVDDAANMIHVEIAKETVVVIARDSITSVLDKTAMVANDIDEKPKAKPTPKKKPASKTASTAKKTPTKKSK